MRMTHIPNDPFLVFVQLVEADQKIYNFFAQQEQYAREIDNLKQLLEDRSAKAAIEREKANVLRKQLAAYELSLKTLQSREKNVRHKMGFVAAPKEYTALEHELQIIEKEKNSTEDKAFAVWPELEVAEAKSITIDQEFKLYQAQVEAQIAELQAAKAEHAGELGALQAARLELLKIAPEAYVTKYESMRASVPNPVVPVVGLECSACATEVTGTMMTQLKKHLLVMCPECYRLLYRV